MALAIGLAGCDSPSMKFQGMTPTKITVGDAVFSIRHTKYQAEAIRANAMWPPPRRNAIVIKGVEAIERVTHCPIIVDSVRGDANLVAADLNCPGVPKRIRPSRPAHLDCTAYETGGLSGDWIDIDCDIVR